MWMGLGQQVAIANGSYIIETKPVSIEQCSCLNSTLIAEEVAPTNE